MKLVRLSFKLLFISLASFSGDAQADDFIADWFRAVEAEQKIELLAKQVVDFEKYQGDPTEQVEYEPTGERFAGIEQIRQALPIKKQQLIQLKRAYRIYARSES